MNKKFLLSTIFISIIGLSGCHFNNQEAHHIQAKVEKSTYQKLSSQTNSQSSISSSKELESPKNIIKQSDNINQHQNNNQSNIQNINQSNTNQQNSNGITIPNENVAGIYLKQQLGYGNNSNIVAGNDPSYDGNDQNGHFYIVSLMDMSDRVQGKTGSMGIYRVYSNGKIVQVAQ